MRKKEKSKFKTNNTREIKLKDTQEVDQIK